MTRERLPNRRASVTTTAVWPINGGAPLHVSLGFDASGRPRELFARSKRPDTDLDSVADDGAVLVSLCLQTGMSLDEIGHSLGRANGHPTSLLGALVDTARKIEAELRGPRLVAALEPAP